MSDLVRNPGDRFSHDEALVIQLEKTVFYMGQNNLGCETEVNNFVSTLCASCFLLLFLAFGVFMKFTKSKAKSTVCTHTQRN